MPSMQSPSIHAHPHSHTATCGKATLNPHLPLPDAAPRAAAAAAAPGCGTGERATSAFRDCGRWLVAATAGGPEGSRREEGEHVDM